MDIGQLEEIVRCAREALTERKRLQRLHDGYIKRTSSGGRTRASTTTYNASAAHAAERARMYEAELKRMVLGEE